MEEQNVPAHLLCSEEYESPLRCDFSKQNLSFNSSPYFCCSMHEGLMTQEFYSDEDDMELPADAEAETIVFNLEIPHDVKNLIKCLVNRSEKGCDPMESSSQSLQSLAKMPVTGSADCQVILPRKRPIQSEEHIPLLTIPKLIPKKKRSPIFEAIQSFDCKH